MMGSIIQLFHVCSHFGNNMFLPKYKLAPPIDGNIKPVYSVMPNLNSFFKNIIAFHVVQFLPILGHM